MKKVLVRAHDTKCTGSRENGKSNYESFDDSANDTISPTQEPGYKCPSMRAMVASIAFQVLIGA